MFGRYLIFGSTYIECSVGDFASTEVRFAYKGQCGPGSTNVLRCELHVFYIEFVFKELIVNIA